MKWWIETDEQRDRFVRLFPQCENILRYNLPLGVMVDDNDWKWFASRDDYDAAVANEISQQNITTITSNQLSAHGVFFDPKGYTTIKAADKEQFDAVNRPRHYADSKVECIDAMEAALGKEAVASFALCNTFKYLWRRDGKGGEEDVRKALWYFDKYKELVNE